MSFGKRLAEYRKALGITQSEMSKMIGVARSTYALYEIDRNEPTLKTLNKIRKIFQQPYSYLLDGDDNSIE